MCARVVPYWFGYPVATNAQTKHFVAHFRRGYLATRDDVKQAIKPMTRNWSMQG